MQSTLAVTLDDLQAEVGDSAGYGRGRKSGSNTWDSVQQGQIDACVKTGLRWVYKTEEVRAPSGEVIIPADYEWSFLAPKAQLTLPSGALEILLPDDFGGIRSEVIPVGSNRQVLVDVPLVGELELYRNRTVSPDQVGIPRLAHVEPLKGTTLTRSTRWKLSIFPTSDQEYTLNVWYDVLPDALTEALPYVYGGAVHAETFLAAVRAAYESKYLNMRNDVGPEKAAFREQLRSSVQRDRKFKPLRLGKNLDHSDDVYLHRPTGTIHFDYMGIAPG